jgi:cytochrome P450
MSSSTTTPDGSVAAASANEATMRLPLPRELIDRGGCPFDPPAALERMREQAPVSEVTMLNGSTVWMVTGYDEARRVLSDPRFSSDLFRHNPMPLDVPEQVRE